MVNYSRMSRAEALSALRLVKTQLVTHRGLCGVCIQAQRAKAMRATSWATWTPRTGGGRARALSSDKGCVLPECLLSGILAMRPRLVMRHWMS